jgi:hypothetical protein
LAEKIAVCAYTYNPSAGKERVLGVFLHEAAQTLNSFQIEKIKIK